MLVVPVGGGAAGPGFYFEVVFGGAGFKCAGVCSSLPTDGLLIGQDQTSWGYGSNGSVFRNSNGVAVYSLTSYASGDVVSVLARGGFVWFAKNGVLQNSGLPAVGGLAGTYYPATSIGSGSGGTATVRFASGSWSYTPPSGFATIGESAVWADENTITLSGGNLIATAGSVADYTPVRSTTGFAIASAAEQASITLADL